MTSSRFPGRTAPVATSARASASVPLAMPAEALAPQKRAHSRSKASTSRPRMYVPPVRTCSTAARTSSATSSCCLLRSRKLTGIGFQTVCPVPPVDLDRGAQAFAQRRRRPPAERRLYLGEARMRVAHVDQLPLGREGNCAHRAAPRERNQFLGQLGQRDRLVAAEVVDLALGLLARTGEDQ